MTRDIQHVGTYLKTTTAAQLVSFLKPSTDLASPKSNTPDVRTFARTDSQVTKNGSRSMGIDRYGAPFELLRREVASLWWTDFKKTPSRCFQHSGHYHWSFSVPLQPTIIRMNAKLKVLLFTIVLLANVVTQGESFTSAHGGVGGKRSTKQVKT